MKRYLAVFSFILIPIYLFVSPISYEIDFYWYHVWECVEAHREGYAISICSGFWVKPSNVEDGPCCVMPWENPVLEVGHGSNLGTRDWARGYFDYVKQVHDEREYNREMVKSWFDNYADNYDYNPTPSKLLRKCNSYRPLLVFPETGVLLLLIFGIILLWNRGLRGTTKDA